MTTGLEDLDITPDFLRGIKVAYRTVIGIIEDNPELTSNEIKAIFERQLSLEENN